jgi:peptide chain release factor 1
MFDKLESAEQRFEEMGVLLTRPEVINDNEQYTKLSKEYSQMTPIIEKYREYKNATSSEKEARELLDAG